MRKIKVRKHKRRLRTGGITIVRRHNRNLNSNIEMRSKVKQFKFQEDFPSGLPEIPEFDQNLPMISGEIIVTPLGDLSVKTEIGTQAERSYGSYKSPSISFERLHKLERVYMPYEDIIKNEIYFESNRLINALNLPSKLEYSVVDRAYKLFDQFGKSTLYRSAKYVVPIALYYEVLDKEIAIPWATIIEHVADKDKPKIKRSLIHSLRSDLNLYKKLHTPEYRKRRIKQFLLTLQTQNNLPFEFYKITSRNLDNHFDKLSNKKDTVVAALLWDDAIRKHFKGIKKSRGFEYLRLTQSIAANTRKREDLSYLEESRTIEGPREDLWFLF